MIFALLTLAVIGAATAQPLGQPPTAVCVFDIDQTLTRSPFASPTQCNVTAFAPTVGGRQPAAYAYESMAACYNLGYLVAIATAEPQIIAQLMEPFLTNISAGEMGATFFASPGFGYGNGNKTDMLKAIQVFYKASPSCMILFDDQIINDQTAEAIGMDGQEVSVECGGSNPLCLTACGLTVVTLSQGLAKLKATCGGL